LVRLLVDEEPRGLRAILAAVHHRRGDGAFRGGGDVRVVEDDERRLAAELEMELLHVRLCGFHDVLPGRRVPGQGDHVDLVTRRELVPDDRAWTRDQVHDAGWYWGLFDQVSQL